MKTKHTNKLLVLVISLMMIVTLFAGMSITASAEDTTTYKIWVGGEQFTSDKLTITDDNGGTATYDPDTHTLSLSNYNYTGEGYTSGDETYVVLSGIFVEQRKYDDATGIYTPLNLVITGQNSITVTPTGDETVSGIYGIQSFYPICVIGGSDGEDSLTVTSSGEAELVSYAVWIDADLTVKNCNLVAINDVVAPAKIGVYAYNITVSDGGKLAAICDTTNNGGEGIILYEGSITVDDGEIVSQGLFAFTGNQLSIDETPAAVIWYGDSETAAKAAGAKPSSELANNYCKYVKIAPASSCDHIGSTNKPAATGNGKHSFTCSVCDVTVEEAHTIVDDVCTGCNEPNYKIIGQQVNLGGDISMKYYVRTLEAINSENLTMQFLFLGELTEVKALPVADKPNTYYFVLEGINPQCMGDEIDAVLYMDGEEVDSLLDYSVKANLVSIYDDSNDATKQLIIDTLEYGAAAQTYREYKLDALVTMGLPEAMNAHLNDAEKNVDVSIPKSSHIVNETVANTIGEATVHFSSVNYIKITYNDGEIKTLASDAIAAYDFAKKMQFSAEGLFTLGYSVNDYCYDVLNSEKANDAMKSLAKALYNYGLSAHIVKGNHTGGEATCMHGKYCDICGFEYDTATDRENHASGEFIYTANEDGTTHKKAYKCCGATVTESEAHTLTYSANGNVIAGSCSVNCGHTATATISAADTTYNGNEQMTATVAYSEGWIGGELTVSYVNNVNAGTATARITVDEATASVDFTIAKATLTVTAKDHTITYGDAAANNGVTYTGFVNGENENVLGGELTYSYTYTKNDKVGKYAISITGLTSDNYDITFVGATLTVTAKNVSDATIELGVYNSVYDGNAKTPAVTSVTVNGVLLENGKDFIVYYKDNVYVGDAKVVIEFIGNYEGVFEKTFEITQDPKTTAFEGVGVTIPKTDPNE